MDRVIYTQSSGIAAIIIPSPEYLENHTIEEIAAKDVPSGLAYSIVPEEDVPSDTTFRDAWVISGGGTIEPDFTLSKNIAIQKVKLQTAEEQTAILDGYTSEVLAAQATLPEESRDPEIQSKFAAVNDLNTQLQSQIAAIEAATDMDTLYNIVQKPSGVLNTGRGGSGEAALDLNPSYFVSLDSLPPGVGEPELELYVPGTNTVIPYNAGLPTPYRFDSGGDCFVEGDFRLVIRIAANGDVLSTITVPLGANVDVPWVYNSTIPPA